MKTFYLPVLIQGGVMLFDEFYFHEKRKLPQWERWGHPLDTLTVLGPLLFILIQPFSEHNLRTFIILGILSCIFITKDEFVHKELCSGAEQWLHSLLFVLHPLVFLCNALLWKEGDTTFLAGQLAVVASFFLYQLTRWSLPWATK